MAYKQYKVRKPNGNGRESDHRVVPMRWGNARRGKAVTHLSA